MLATHDYQNMLPIVKNMWHEVNVLASSMPKCKNIMTSGLKVDLIYQLKNKWEVLNNTRKNVEKFHPYATMDMQTHTKMSLYETLSVVTHTI